LPAIGPGIHRGDLYREILVGAVKGVFAPGIAAAAAAGMFTLGAAWGTCRDLGGNQAGVVSAAMNTSGQSESVLSPLMMTSLLAQTGDWNAPPWVMGSLFLLGSVAWWGIDPRERIA